MTWLYQIQPNIEINRSSSIDHLTYVGIVREDFWSENEHFDDQHIGDRIREDHPDFEAEEVMEGLFEVGRTADETETYLNQLGLQPLE